VKFTFSIAEMVVEIKIAAVTDKVVMEMLLDPAHRFSLSTGLKKGHNFPGYLADGGWAPMFY
jgi:hypothetical protein